MLLAGCRLPARNSSGTNMSRKEKQQPDFVCRHGKAPFYGGKGAMSVEVGVRVPPRSDRTMSAKNLDDSGGDSSHVRCTFRHFFISNHYTPTIPEKYIGVCETHLAERHRHTVANVDLFFSRALSADHFLYGPLTFPSYSANKSHVSLLVVCGSWERR